MITAILNVEEAGVYSESKVDAFQVFFAHSSSYSYLYILYGLMIPLSSLLALFLLNIPFQHPSLEVTISGMFFLVNMLGGTVLGFAIVYNFKAFFPELQLGFVSMMIIGLTFGSSHTGAIGFLVPFAGTYPAIPANMAAFGMAYFLFENRFRKLRIFRSVFDIFFNLHKSQAVPSYSSLPCRIGSTIHQHNHHCSLGYILSHRKIGPTIALFNVPVHT